MTILEERFMNCIPASLRGIEKELQSMSKPYALPIIKFKDKDGGIRIEQFSDIEEYPHSEFPKYKVNGYTVDESEYRRIEKIITNHPLFIND